MDMKERSKQLAVEGCISCHGEGVIFIGDKLESCNCTIRTFPDWKGNKVTMKPSDPWFEHDFNRRPG